MIRRYLLLGREVWRVETDDQPTEDTSPGTTTTHHIGFVDDIPDDLPGEHRRGW